MLEARFFPVYSLLVTSREPENKPIRVRFELTEVDFGVARIDFYIVDAVEPIRTFVPLILVVFVCGHKEDVSGSWTFDLGRGFHFDENLLLCGWVDRKDVISIVI